MLGSGLRPACTDWSAFGPMLISEMEAVLKSLDQRVGRIEQILPTLVTKSDLHGLATKADLERYATKADLERFATKTELERFATKTELERFATKTELRDEIRGVKVLVEDARSETRLIAEHLSTLMSQMLEVLRRLERIEHR